VRLRRRARRRAALGRGAERGGRHPARPRRGRVAVRRLALRPETHAHARPRTMATAGRTVVFSAATVAVALVGLAVFPDPPIRSLAYGGVGVVLTTMFAAVTLLPALLAWGGHRLSPR